MRAAWVRAHAGVCACCRCALPLNFGLLHALLDDYTYPMIGLAAATLLSLLPLVAVHCAPPPHPPLPPPPLDPPPHSPPPATAAAAAVKDGTRGGGCTEARLLLRAPLALLRASRFLRGFLPGLIVFLPGRTVR